MLVVQAISTDRQSGGTVSNCTAGGGGGGGAGGWQHRQSGGGGEVCAQLLLGASVTSVAVVVAVHQVLQVRHWWFRWWQVLAEQAGHSAITLVAVVAVADGLCNGGAGGSGIVIIRYPIGLTEQQWHTSQNQLRQPSTTVIDRSRRTRMPTAQMCHNLLVGTWVQTRQRIDIPETNAGTATLMMNCRSV
jgi:hypothetical protein